MIVGRSTVFEPARVAPILMGLSERNTSSKVRIPLKPMKAHASVSVPGAPTQPTSRCGTFTPLSPSASRNAMELFQIPTVRPSALDFPAT